MDGLSHLGISGVAEVKKRGEGQGVFQMFIESRPRSLDRGRAFLSGLCMLSVNRDCPQSGDLAWTPRPWKLVEHRDQTLESDRSEV